MGWGQGGSGKFPNRNYAGVNLGLGGVRAKLVGPKGRKVIGEVSPGLILPDWGGNFRIPSWEDY